MAFEDIKLDLEKKLVDIADDGLISLIGQTIDNINGFNRDPNAGKYAGVFRDRLNPFLQEIDKLFGEDQNRQKNEIIAIETKEHENKSKTLRDLLSISSAKLSDGEIRYVEDLNEFYVFDRQLSGNGIVPDTHSKKGGIKKEFGGRWKKITENTQGIRNLITDSPEIKNLDTRLNNVPGISIELVKEEISNIIIANSTMGYVSIFRTSLLSDETGYYWFDFFLESQSNIDNKKIVFQIKILDTVVLEFSELITLKDINKIINGSTKQTLVEKEFPISFEILFKLYDLGGEVKITKAHIKTYRQRIPPSPGGTPSPGGAR